MKIFSYLLMSLLCFSKLLVADCTPGIVNIEAGDAFVLALTNDGEVQSWGANNNGQLGNNTLTNSNTPVLVVDPANPAEPLKNIIAIAGGANHALALTNDGTIWAWGSNASGQLGNNTIVNSSIPVQVLASPGIPLQNIIAIAAGRAQSLALTNEGTVYAWGYNDYGQLGNGLISTTAGTYPNLVLDSAGVNPLANISKIICGNYHALALTSEGTLFAWGRNTDGQLGNGTTTQSSLPVQVLTSITPSVDFIDTIAIGAGDLFSVALLDNAAVFAWGNNATGQLGNGTITSSSLPVQTSNLNGTNGFKSVSMGGFQLTALKTGGTVSNAGDNTYGQLGNGNNTNSSVLVQVTDPLNASLFLQDIKKISSGLGHVLALTSNGEIQSWGLNNRGQLGDNTTTDSNIPVLVINSTNTSTLQNIIDVDTGDFHSLALADSGLVWAWGANVDGQLGNGTNTQSNLPVQVLAVALPSPLPLENITAVSAGSFSSFALTSEGTVFSWGDNSLGQLGNGTFADTNLAGQVLASLTPSTIALTNIKAISAGSVHTLALTNNGTVVAWGRNASGQLGNGTFTDSNLPMQVLDSTGTQPLQNIIAISAGGFHSLALTNEGQILAWGDNESGVLGNGTNVNSNLPVLVLDPTGTAFLQDIVAISGGTVGSAALNNDGIIYAWGDNRFGQLGNGTTVNANLPTMALLTSNLFITPPAQTICNNTSTNIALSSQFTGVDFQWEVPINDLGATNGTGSTIAQVLTNTTEDPQTIVYTIRSFDADGCPGATGVATITVNPELVVTAIPFEETISSGDLTAIALSANLSGSTFAWTVTSSSNVTGASNGTGSSINQTLVNTSTVDGTVTYQIVATSPEGCVSMSASVVVTVLPPTGKLGSKITIDPSSVNAPFGLFVPINVTVSNSLPSVGAPIPTGTVTFNEGPGGLNQTFTLDANGAVTVNFAQLGVGRHAFLVTYSGDVNYNLSRTTFVYTVEKSNSVTTLMSDFNPSLVGQTVTIVATVGTTTGLAFPTGTVNLFDGTTLIATGVLNSTQQVFFQVSNLPVGDRTLYAQYLGDGNNNPSRSRDLVQTVVGNIIPTQTQIMVNQPAVLGQPVTLLIDVNSALTQFDPRGQVTVAINGVNAGTFDLTNGQVSFTTSALLLGSNTITATYLGTAIFQSSSTSIVVTVTGIQSPTNFSAKQIKNRFATQTDLVNRLSWSAPSGSIQPVAYYLYRNSLTSTPIATIAADHKLRYKDHDRRPNTSYTYYLVAVDANGNLSAPSVVTIRK